MTATALTTTSTFVAPLGLPSDWSLVQSTMVSGSSSFAVGYLGSNTDMSVIFWRSFAGGPIETWMREGVAITA